MSTPTTINAATPVTTAPPTHDGGGEPIVAANGTLSANDNGPARATPYAPVTNGIGRRTAANDTAPLHTQTQSTLAPTSEWVRYLLLVLPARYIPRGVFGIVLEEKPYLGNRFARAVNGFLTKPGEWLQHRYPGSTKEHKEALAYNAILGLGSMALTASYSWTVYKDIKNIFSETVADEIGKPVDKVTFKDLQHSDNRIIQKTMDNYWRRLKKRAITDLFFFPAAVLRNPSFGDLMIGIKAGQAFGETWKRKTTMFEDLITFVNNKINPRNGLGQAIGVGEIFDLYQHYAQEYNPGQDFSNVLERGTGEGAVWAQNQPIFERITQLMNLTYAYKHSSLLDPDTGHAIRQADFELPKFIYLLGHDLIDVKHPDVTLARIEIANRYGIGAVKDMQSMLQTGASLAQINQHFPVEAHAPVPQKEPVSEKNGVIAKGSTVQLDRSEAFTPTTMIDANSIANSTLMQASPVLVPQL